MEKLHSGGSHEQSNMVVEKNKSASRYMWITIDNALKWRNRRSAVGIVRFEICKDKALVRFVYVFASPFTGPAFEFFFYSFLLILVHNCDWWHHSASNFSTTFSATSTPHDILHNFTANRTGATSPCEIKTPNPLRRDFHPLAPV